MRALVAPDIDFSADDGWAETRHVFLEGNGLPAAWSVARFVVSELGFGTGLNAVALAHLAQSERGAGRAVPWLVYQSVEWQPRPPAQLEALAQRWPALRPQVEALLAVYQPQPGWNRWSWPWGDLALYWGDARALPLEPWEPAHAWFLDGYAPDRNPELWTPELLRWVGQQTLEGGSVATYSAAGVVKRGLREAGFNVVRRPGWGHKRHMVQGRKSQAR